MLPIAEAIREALAGRADVRLALLFGSRARADARAESDVDVAVETADGTDLLALASLLRGSSVVRSTSFPWTRPASRCSRR